MSSNPNDPTQSHQPDDPNATVSHQATPDFTLSGSQVPKNIGPYKLLQRIGEGGMGEVWMAEQSEPVKRRVALKLIKTGVGSKEIIARFEAERQALSLMNHPNIARILDAGTTADGQPWFAMELVQGKPFTTYCDENRLSIDDRLELFADVCSGVQHAHQKGIIHRDLKPGNILVTVADGKAVPKVIDFGLAKAMESTQRLTDQSLFTGIGQILGTLKYMSPEQASLDGIDIDTRTDIYALGVILYELLTGSTPLDDSSIKGQAALKILELIRDKEPVKPSSRLGSSTAEQVSTITGQRKTDSVRLNRVLAGDLDWIVMKALEKDRTRRYESASGFAADIRRYLNSEPVIARPPSLNYRVRKFVRKNRVGVIAASLVLLALIGGIIGTGFGLWEAKRQEKIAKKEVIAKNAALKEAESNLAFARKGNEVLGSVFADLDPEAEYYRVSELRNALRDNLEKAVKLLDGSAIGDPLEVAQMQNTLGKSLLGLGQFAQALELFERSIKTIKIKLGPDHPDTLSAMGMLALGYSNNYQLDKALPLCEERLALSKDKLGLNHPETLNSMHNLAIEYRNAGQLDKSLPLLEQTLALSKSELGPDHRFTLIAMSTLAGCYVDAGQLEKALPLFEHALPLMKDKLGPNHPRTLRLMTGLGWDYSMAGEAKKVQSLIKQQVALCHDQLGPDHPQTLYFMVSLANSYLSAGQRDEALPLYEQSLALQKDRLGSNHPHTLRSINALAGWYRDAGQLDKALPLYEQALELRKAKLGPNHADTLESMNGLALGYRDAGQLDKALPLLEQTLELRKAKLGPDHFSTQTSMNNLAQGHMYAGRPEKALPLFEETLELSKAKLGPEHSYTLATISNLAKCHQSVGQLDKAMTLYEKVMPLMKDKLGPDHPDTLSTMVKLAEYYKSVNQFDKALPLFEETLELSKSKLGPDHPQTIDSMVKLAEYYKSVNQFDKALPLFEETLELRKSKLGPDHPQTIDSMSNLATEYWFAKQLDKSIPLFERALELQIGKRGKNHFNTIATLANLGVNYKDAGRIEKAIPMLEEASERSKPWPQLAWVKHALRDAYIKGKRIEKFESLAKADLAAARKSLTGGSPELANLLVAVGRDYLNIGNAAQAEVLLTEGVQIRQQVAPDAWNTFNAQSLLGGALLAQTFSLTDGTEKGVLFAKAEPLLIQGYEGMKKRGSTIPPNSANYIPEALDRLIELYTALEKPEEVKKYQELRSQYPANASADGK